MKLKEALDYFLLVDRAEQTRDTYAKFLRRFVAAIGPERPLDLIRPEDLDAYIYEMRTRTTKYADHPFHPTEENAKLSSTTIHKNVKMIKAFFSWCVKREYLTISPARHLSNPKPVRPLGQGKAATDNEIELMLAGAQFNCRDRAIVLLLAQSGCRAGEAAELRLDDLELDNLSALITGKGDKRRRIYFGAETAAALGAWLEERPVVKHNRVFTSVRDNHAPLTADAISRVVRRLSDKVGLDRSLGAHSLRHRVGQTLARQHVPVRVTQAYLGHTRPEITFGYYQDVEETDLRQAGKFLNLSVPPANEEELRSQQKADETIKRFRRLGTG